MGISRFAPFSAVTVSRHEIWQAHKLVLQAEIIAPDIREIRFPARKIHMRV
jgi:hypothetical protein